jgi:hypothetical protein
VKAGGKLKMEEICFPETLVGFQRTAWRFIPEDITLQEIVNI